MIKWDKIAFLQTFTVFWTRSKYMNYTLLDDAINFLLRISSVNLTKSIKKMWILSDLVKNL